MPQKSLNQYKDMPDRRRQNTKTRAEKNRGFRNWLRERKRLRKQRREAQPVSAASMQTYTSPISGPAWRNPPLDEGDGDSLTVHLEGAVWTDLDMSVGPERTAFSPAPVERGSEIDITPDAPQLEDTLDVTSKPHEEWVDTSKAKTIEQVEFSTYSSPFRAPFKCAQEKSEAGWQVLDANGKVAGVAVSRSKARALRDELNNRSNVMKQRRLALDIVDREGRADLQTDMRFYVQIIDHTPRESTIMSDAFAPSLPEAIAKAAAGMDA